MSYSFTVSAPGKDEAKQKVAAEFDKIVLSQPVHAADRDAAQTAAGAFIDVLNDPADGEEIRISVHGSVSWKGLSEGSAADFTHSNLGISASRQAIPAAQAA